MKAKRSDVAELRCWAEINLSALRHNLTIIKSMLPAEASFLAVVKANAYGHCAPVIAKECVKAGARYLAVACLEEALELREAGITAPILIFTTCFLNCLKEVVKEDITLPISSLSEAEAISACWKRLHRTSEGEVPKVKVHFACDSGMARLGFSLREKDLDSSLAEMEKVANLPGLELEGIFTHFATACSEDPTYLELQFKRFQEGITRLEEKGIRFKLRHCANSATFLTRAEMILDMARPGVILYGGRDGDFMKDFDFRPVMALRARLSFVRALEAGEGISYGLTYHSEQPMRVGVLECGYADGLHRVLSNKAEFSLKGKKIRQVGRICMDRCMVDLSEVPEAKIGDVVTLFGQAGEDFVDAEEQANLAGSISYELFTSVHSRVPRIFIEEE